MTNRAFGCVPSVARRVLTVPHTRGELFPVQAYKQSTLPLTSLINAPNPAICFIGRAGKVNCSIKMATDEIVLFDLASKPPCRTWSYNPWKARFVINFKGLKYKTEWLQYPDLKPRLAAHHDA
ncbi:hypothetical protein F4780DRAFT_151175 [Xylariomycetidae sp. FL0641]|nr:hypothetical protein F4780DRAFT_151175 [Xylariomycetidae sp. FL0641]